MTPLYRICPVILCGGSGTRLWPVSTSKIPKQFISLGEKGTLLEETLRRVQLVTESCHQYGYDSIDPLLIMHKSHVLPLELSSHQSNVVYEDFANDTAVAVAKAVMEISDRYGDENIIMIVLPADHYIENVNAFVNDITHGIRQVNTDNIVLYGIDPTAPETKYGYIIPSEEGIKFREKPDRDTAIQLISQNALWNSGIFAASVQLVKLCLDNSPHCIMDWVYYPKPGKAPSFDVAVLQEYPNIYAHHCTNWKWSDVGSFMAFTAIPEVRAEIENSSVITSACSNVCVLNRNQTNIVMIGCSDLFVIANGSDLLIMSNRADYDNYLKEIASKMI